MFKELDWKPARVQVRVANGQATFTSNTFDELKAVDDISFSVGASCVPCGVSKLADHSDGSTGPEPVSPRRTICQSRTYQLSVSRNKWNEDDTIVYVSSLASNGLLDRPDFLRGDRRRPLGGGPLAARSASSSPTPSGRSR